MSAAVQVRNLGKEYSAYHVNRPGTLKEAFVRRFRDVLPRERFWALRDVSFDVGPSEIVGVIGANGAGKSTLLRLIGGVGRPDTGSVEVTGRISALLDLGAAFHPELTGRENIFVSGVIAGLSRSEVRERFDMIVEFAELAAFVDSPLRTYSSGMQLRLAFAINIHTAPRILLVDEVLSVGDMAFQKKCLDHVKKIQTEGCAIVLVSHDLNQVKLLCDRALWLKAGRVVLQGAPETVVKQYEDSMMAETRERMPDEWPVSVTASGTELRINENRFGSMELEIAEVRLLNSGNQVASRIKSGHALKVEIRYRAHRCIEMPVFTVAIDTDDGKVMAAFSTADSGLEMPKLEGDGKILLDVDRLDLAGGDYYVEVGAYPHDWSFTYDYHWQAHRLGVITDLPGKGFLNPPHRWALI